MNQTREGLLLVVSGPAGVGKGTIDKNLLDNHQSMCLSVSATTRKPRPGEIDGVHYFFVSEEKFNQMIDENAFLEYMNVFGMNYYGTPRAFVEERIHAGKDVLLEIDVNGALAVKKAYPEAVLIFIAPPNMGALRERLLNRNTETPEQMEKRLSTAYSEVAQMKHYDYVVINDILDEAIRNVESIIRAEKCKIERNRALTEEFEKTGDR